MPVTSDPNDPRIRRGPDTEPGQHDTYLVLSPEEIAKGFKRPLRDTYKHAKCGATTSMGPTLAQTWARDPSFYGYTFCAVCDHHFPVSEFTWLDDGTQLGT